MAASWPSGGDTSAKGDSTGSCQEQTAWRLRGAAGLRSMAIGVQRASGGGFTLEDEAAVALLQHLETTIQRCSSQPATTLDADAQQRRDAFQQRIQHWLLSQRGSAWLTAARAATSAVSSASGKGTCGDSNASGDGGGRPPADTDRQAADTADGAKCSSSGTSAPADVAVCQTAQEDPLLQGGRWRVPLCPASLEPVDSCGAAWECGVCMRLYASSVTARELGCSGPPQCVMCGVRLRRHVIPGFLPEVGL